MNLFPLAVFLFCTDPEIATLDTIQTHQQNVVAESPYKTWEHLGGDGLGFKQQIIIGCYFFYRERMQILVLIYFLRLASY